MPTEIKRIEYWSDGTINCLKCGKEIVLYYNGGELDSQECCGLLYKTESIRIDLVIYENKEVLSDKPE